MRIGSHRDDIGTTFTSSENTRMALNVSVSDKDYLYWITPGFPYRT